MAARIAVEVGNVAGERTFGDQAKAATTLDAFYTAMALGPEDATNKQKLDAIADHLARYITGMARNQHVAAGRAALNAEADASFGVD